MSANINIGKLIKQVRKESGLTQEELAEKSDLSVNFISRIERTDNQNISWKNIEAIAEALGLSTIERLQVNENRQRHRGLYLTKLMRILEEMNELEAEELSKNIIDIIELLQRKK